MQLEDPRQKSTQQSSFQPTDKEEDDTKEFHQEDKGKPSQEEDKNKKQEKQYQEEHTLRKEEEEEELSDLVNRELIDFIDTKIDLEHKPPPSPSKRSEAVSRQTSRQNQPEDRIPIPSTGRTPSRPYSQQGHSNSLIDVSDDQNRKKSRKVRTTITREKLLEMNQIFKAYLAMKVQNKNPSENLKEIGIRLQLGYSTILHKFREFRHHKMVKGGALIASLQKKRKYKKSLVIENIIDQALATKPFYTAVELADYIEAMYNNRYSRSIISRHLGEMGYSYKNLKSSPTEKHNPEYVKTRRIYSDIAYPYLSSDTSKVLFIDELACNLSAFQRKKTSGLPKEDNPMEYTSIMLGVTTERIVYYETKQGFFNGEEFSGFLEFCTNKIIQESYNNIEPPINTMVLITDLNRIHFDRFDIKEDENSIAAVVARLNLLRLFLPPESPHINPLEALFTNLKARLLKKDIKTSQNLKKEMEGCVSEMMRESVDVYFAEALKCVAASKTCRDGSCPEEEEEEGEDEDDVESDDSDEQEECYIEMDGSNNFSMSKEEESFQMSKEEESSSMSKEEESSSMSKEEESSSMSKEESSSMSKEEKYFSRCQEEDDEESYSVGKDEFYSESQDSSYIRTELLKQEDIWPNIQEEMIQ